jgi:hypothetical protein
MVAFDAVLDAVRGPGRPVAGSGFALGEQHPVGSALVDWRRAGATSLRLSLPVPGDLRGLGPAVDAGFRDIALDAGQAAVGPGFALSYLLAPQTPSSAGRSVIWHRGDLLPQLPDQALPDQALHGARASQPLNPGTEFQPSDYVPLHDAEHELTEAIRETASLLAARDAPSWLSDVAPALANARRAGEKLHLPSSHPPRAVRVLAQAERMAAVFDVIDADRSGEVTAAGMQERAEVLAPLRTAVRRALVAGYNAAAEVSAT